MKEIRSIISKYEQLKTTGTKMALATVVNVEYSSYRRSGARMLITEDGNWVGGISGGCLEGDTLKKAMYAIHKNEAVKVTYDTREDDPNQIGVGLGCNGLIDVLIVPIRDLENNPIEILKEIVDRRTPSILVTNLEFGHTEDFTINQSKSLALNREINNVKANTQSRKTDLENGYFIEYLQPEIALYIFGKNYDVIPLAQIAKDIGWKIKVVANPLKVSKQIFELVDEVINPAKKSIQPDDYSVALLISHDYKTDKENLTKLQAHNLKYIGLLGPKKRKDKMLNELDSETITVRHDNIYGPMGLDTGATSPEEIAISIVAEIRACFSDRAGGKLRDRDLSIHI
ncbi:MAG: xanthine dehydrogenase accessory factor [Saprospiraceae bacterium]|jgi:xanthine/CO dehydrogenase XdhC/CoxF family maturation factor